MTAGGLFVSTTPFYPLNGERICSWSVLKRLSPGDRGSTSIRPPTEAEAKAMIAERTKSVAYPRLLKGEPLKDAAASK
jgi:hypothetical protein